MMSVKVVVVVAAIIASSIAMPQGGFCPNGDPWNADFNTVDANGCTVGYCAKVCPTGAFTNDGRSATFRGNRGSAFFTGCPTTRSSFLDVFGEVYEKTPWIPESVWPEHFENVEKLWDVTNAKSVENLLLAMRKSVDMSEKEKKLALLKSHPDLAGKLAVATFEEGVTDEKSETALTSHSKEEHKSAGLDQLSPEEFEKFMSNNKAYWEKFEFPYILAVSGRTPAEILENFTKRLGNEVDAEFSECIEQVHQIAKIRVGKIVEECKRNFIRR